jgi:gliding motility associated protien GldN
MKKYILIILTSLTYQSFSQLPPYEYSPYPRSIPNEGTAVAPRYLGEQRVKYSKRIHRVIDSRMKQNKDITWPRNPLNKVLWKAVIEGYPELGQPKAYASDSLASTLSLSAIKSKVEDTVWVWVPNPNNPTDPNDLIEIAIFEPFDPGTIKKFRIMEDWIFDVQHSDLRPRIIAIAPMYQVRSQTGVDLGEAELFWIKMDDLRPILAQQEIFNTFNDAARLSYDHWFEMRLFSSHIVKESNVYDLDIAYLEGFRDAGVEALLEADKIKNDLYVTEHDLWEY